MFELTETQFLYGFIVTTLILFLPVIFGKQKKWAKVSLALWSIGFIIVILFASSKDDWIAIMGSIIMISGLVLFLFKEITALFWEVKRNK